MKSSGRGFITDLSNECIHEIMAALLKVPTSKVNGVSFDQIAKGLRELLAYREAQDKVVAYYYPGSDTDTEQLGFPHQLDEEQKGNCLPLYAAPQLPAVPKLPRDI